MGFPGGTVVKHAGDASSIPGSGRSPGEGNGNLPSILAWRVPWEEEPDPGIELASPACFTTAPPGKPIA